MHPFRIFAAAVFALSAISAQAVTFRSYAEGYTTIALDSYANLTLTANLHCRNIFCSPVQSKFMPVVTNNTPTQSTSSGGDVQEIVTNTIKGGPSPESNITNVAAFASASAGGVHVSASNSTRTGPIAVLDPDGVRNLPSPYTAIAGAAAGASFNDTLHVSSGNLPIGAPVSFFVHFYLEGTLNGGSNTFDPFGNSPTMGYRVTWLNPVGSGVSTGFHGFTDCGGGCDLDQLRVGGAGVPVNARIGDSIPIFTGLSVEGTALVDAAHSAAVFPFTKTNIYSISGSADFSNTAGEWVSNIPTGVQITSDSGFDYTVQPNLSAVPLPSSGALMLLGLPLLGRIRKRVS